MPEKIDKAILLNNEKLAEENAVSARKNAERILSDVNDKIEAAIRI